MPPPVHPKVLKALFTQAFLSDSLSQTVLLRFSLCLPLGPLVAGSSMQFPATPCGQCDLLCIVCAAGRPVRFVQAGENTAEECSDRSQLCVFWGRKSDDTEEPPALALKRGEFVEAELRDDGRVYVRGTGRAGGVFGTKTSFVALPILAVQHFKLLAEPGVAYCSILLVTALEVYEIKNSKCLKIFPVAGADASDAIHTVCVSSDDPLTFVAAVITQLGGVYTWGNHKKNGHLISGPNPEGKEVLDYGSFHQVDRPARLDAACALVPAGERIVDVLKFSSRDGPAFAVSDGGRIEVAFDDEGRRKGSWRYTKT